VRETVSVVIPTKNEERNIGWVLRRLPPWIDEVILVDGTSADSTIDVARAVRPDIVVLQEPQPGKGVALRRGFREARGDFVIMIDADGSMDPGEIPLYLERLAEGYDLVKGSRFLRGGGSEDISHLRRSGNRALLGLVNVLYGQRFTELCYGLMGFRAGRIPDLRLRANGFEIETEIVVCAVRAGLSISEVPSFELERRYGTSNLNAFRDGRRILRTLLVERFRSEEPAGLPLEDLVVGDLAPGSVVPPT
jgi:glycosyltransferase involved in cell wall biosynthesis